MPMRMQEIDRLAKDEDHPFEDLLRRIATEGVDWESVLSVRRQAECEKKLVQRFRNISIDMPPERYHQAITDLATVMHIIMNAVLKKRPPNKTKGSLRKRPRYN